MSTRSMVVAVGQMTSTDDVEANLQAVNRLVDRAHTFRAEALLLPECFAFHGPQDGKLAIAESLDEEGPILSYCQRLAREAGLHLILGGFWEKGQRPTHVRNACVHLDASGAIRAVYRKIHLFDVDLPDGTKVEESATVEAGCEAVCTDLPFGKLGLSICYDVRFSALYRSLVEEGAIALAVPAAFTLMTGKDHWHVLLRARAIEQQSYVLAAAQTGLHFADRRSYGHALIADPWGTVLSECGEGEGIAVATIDPEVVTGVRASLPSLAHARWPQPT